MFSFIAADWFPVGKNEFFRKFDLYNMEWAGGFSSDDMLICAAPYGGPIAVVRDRLKLVKVRVPGKPVISIYSSSGIKTGAILWNSGQFINMGWSSDEHLLCVKDTGEVLVYDMFGSFITTFGMGEEASATKIIEAKFFPSSAGTGLAVLTTKLRVFTINSVGDPKVRQFPPLPTKLSKESLTGWEIVSGRETSILISTGRELTLLRHGETPISVKPNFNMECTGFIDMCVSLDNRNLAILSDTGILWMGSSDRNQKYCEVNTKCTSRPKQIVWCGADAVVGNWAHELQIITRDGETATIPSVSSDWLVPEIDGVRILGSFTHEMIQRVPTVTQKLFNLNLTDPGSYLLEASKQYERKSHTSYDLIQLVNNEMDTAVTQCLEGATFEFNPEVQKSLIKAARLGRTFAPDSNSNEFVNMCRVLRVLNAVRGPLIGIPLTYAQLNRLGLRTLLDRLVFRKHYKLAIEMAQFLKLSEKDGASRILAHWACYKVKQTHIEEEKLAVEIGKKLESASGISFSSIASQAVDAGRTQLAIKLLDYEPQPSLQVPLLLRLNQRKPALERAITCGDTDLILCVVLSLRETMPLNELLLLLRSYPLALNLYMNYCRQEAPDILRDIIMQEDNHFAHAEYFLKSFFDSQNTTKEATLNSVIECFTNGKQDFLAGICKDQLKLSNYQKKLEGKYERSFVGKSLHDVIRLLLELEDLKFAEKLRAEYKVSDRHFWWLRLETMADQKEWTEIERFSKLKKSPIGYEPFVDVCLDRKMNSEAMKYLPKVKDELKVKYYVKVNLLTDAANIAIEQKDSEAMKFILRNGGSQIEETSRLQIIASSLIHDVDPKNRQWRWMFSKCKMKGKSYCLRKEMCETIGKKRSMWRSICAKRKEEVQCDEPMIEKSIRCKLIHEAGTILNVREVTYWLNEFIPDDRFDCVGNQQDILFFQEKRKKKKKKADPILLVRPIKNNL